MGILNHWILQNLLGNILVYQKWDFGEIFAIGLCPAVGIGLAFFPSLYKLFMILPKAVRGFTQGNGCDIVWS